MTEQRPRSQYDGPPATLADHAAAGFGLAPTCKRCWHVGATMTPEQIAQRFGVPMTTSHPEIERRLVCAKCGARAGYLQLINPLM
jgi:hypothetical protein